jgi:hypothetical protein
MLMETDALVSRTARFRVRSEFVVASHHFIKLLGVFTRTWFLADLKESETDLPCECLELVKLLAAWIMGDVLLSDGSPSLITRILFGMVESRFFSSC